MKGCIYNRGPSAWLIKYDIGKDPQTGKRRQKYETVRGTKSDAERRLREILGSLDKGTYVEPQKLSLEDWIATWLRDHAAPSVSAKTHERYSQLLKVHVVPHLGSKPIQKVTIPDVNALYSKLRREGLTLSKLQTAKKLGYKAAVANETIGLSEGTLLHVHRALSLVFSEAARSQVVSRNIFKDIKTPRPRRDAVESTEGGIKALEQDQLATIIAGVKDHALFPIVSLAIATGMRRGEILGLRWMDVDFEKHLIRVERSVEVTGANGLRFKSPKNKSSRRTIGVDSGLMAILKAHRTLQLEDHMKLGTRLSQDALVFPYSPMEPTRPMQPHGISKAFSAISSRLGFSGLRFHDLRHTHATLLLTAGVPVNAVAQRLGHSTPVITLSVYGHVLKRAEDQAVAVASSFLRDALGGKK